MTRHEMQLRDDATYENDQAKWAVAEIDRLRAALAVFADPENWDDGGFGEGAVKRIFVSMRHNDPLDFARRELEGPK